MGKVSGHPLAMISSLWIHRSLAWRLIRHDVATRNHGSLIGPLAIFIQPVVMLTLYLFVFVGVFRVHRGVPDNTVDYAFSMFVGMIIVAVFSECINTAPNSLRANVNYVKKVVFPLEILPLIALGSALYRFAASILAMLVCFLLVKDRLNLETVLFPLTLIPLVLYTLGASWMLAAVGTFSTDVGRLAGFATPVLMFISPVFYSSGSVPHSLSTLIRINPLTPAIEGARATLLAGHAPDWPLLGMHTLAALLAAWLGFAFFQHCRSEFADVV
jgi:homopolymeric O-antigen transport system permease protein